MKNKKQNKNKKQKCGVQERFYGKTIGEHIYIYIYKLWNFDNIFLVGIKFKFLKFRCMLHVNFIKTLIVTLSKEIDKNK